MTHPDRLATIPPEATGPTGVRDRSVEWSLVVPAVIGYWLLGVVTLRPGLLGLDLELSSVIWMGSGVALALALRIGYAAVPWIFATEVALTVSVGDGLAHALLTGTGNALELALALALLRALRASIPMGRVRDVLALVVLAAGVSALFGAAISVASLVWFEGLPASSYTRVWLLWWLTHANGMLLGTPLLLSLGGEGMRSMRARPVEAVLIAALILGVAFFLFGAPPGDATARRLLYVPFPLLLWSAFRFRLAGAATANLLLSLTAMVATAAGTGPFATDVTNDALVQLWIFIAVNAITALLVAGVVVEREREVEARLAAEEERRHLSERIQRAQRSESLGMLAGGIAHDFNNLLVTIMGNAELAERKLSSDHPAGRSVAEIMRASQRAAEICRQMLAYAGRGRISNGVVDLNEVAGEMSELMSVSFSDETQLEVRLEEGIPGVWGDVTQLRRVVLNLLTNAGDALSKTGGGRITVSTGRLRPEEIREDDLVTTVRLRAFDLLHLTVEDDGSGMDPEVRDRIFEPFYSTRKTGRGLGLAAVIGIVRAHGGGMELRSSPGQGARFRVILPATRRPIPDPNSHLAAPLDPGEVRGTVLVVEDEEAVREVVVQMLRGQGARVIEAADGIEAIEVWEREGAGIDLVLMDITMPRMDGYETLARLRTIDPSVRVVLTTGNTEEAESAAEEWGVGVLPKPYRSGELRAALSKALAEDAPTARR